MKSLCVIIFLLPISWSVYAQPGHLPYVETVSKAMLEGVTMGHLDSIYKNAVHIDSTKAVFRPGKEQDSMKRAYTSFLQELGKYLSSHDFRWEKPVRCWNRIYFAPDGSVDYYLFDFKTEISDEQLLRFKELFTAFAATHKISIKAAVRFAQCSPVTYMDK